LLHTSSWRGAGVFQLLEAGQTDFSEVLRSLASDGKLNENAIRLYWQALLECVLQCHQSKVIHLDLKPSNFVFVNNTLKIIDFGLAKQVNKDMTSVIRDNQVTFYPRFRSSSYFVIACCLPDDV